MELSKKGRMGTGITEANITPLADVTTTLIVIFLITMPAIMWNGIQVNQAEARSEEAVVTPTTKSTADILTVKIEPDGIWVNDQQVTEVNLERHLRSQLAALSDKTVVVVPNDVVPLGKVVTVLDQAKAAGAVQLALLNEIGKVQ
jgi:biopolymer transport protein ExbD